MKSSGSEGALAGAAEAGKGGGGGAAVEAGGASVEPPWRPPPALGTKADMRQPLVPVFVALALAALPAAFVQGVRSSGSGEASAEARPAAPERLSALEPRARRRS